MKWIELNAPGLLWGPLGWFMTMIVTWVFEVAMKHTVIGGMFFWFDWSTKQELNAVEKALRDIYEFSGTMTPEQVEMYENKLAEAYWELIEVRGAFHILGFVLNIRPDTGRQRVWRGSYNWRARLHNDYYKTA